MKVESRTQRNIKNENAYLPQLEIYRYDCQYPLQTKEQMCFQEQIPKSTGITYKD